ncbi:MAG TPA: hypothetical protein VI873_02970 [Candidatus Peribacteraceae bacterium]|nr:hypothetical protein [Candidatus Peribacteraceae bacterium]
MTFDPEDVDPVQESLTALENAIGEFDVAGYDPNDPMAACIEIYNQCDELSHAYYTLIQLNETIFDPALHNTILRALQLAGQTVPADNVQLHSLIGRWIEDTAAIAMDLEDDSDNDDEE